MASTQPPTPSRREEHRQHLAQCLAAGTISQQQHDEQLFRMTNAGRSPDSRSKLRDKARQDLRRHAAGKLTTAELERKLAIIRQKCSDAGHEPISEANWPSQSA